MKMKKINDNQIKFTISKSDLIERDIKISELVYNSDKTRELFQEMMEQAMNKYNFQAEDTPLMIEAIPDSFEEVIIIVTKVNNPAEIEERFSQLNDETTSMDFDFEITDEIKSRVDDYIGEKNTEVKQNKNLIKKYKNNEYLLIYSFDDLDTVINTIKLLSGKFHGKSSIFKLEDKFYLLLESKKNEFVFNKMVEATLSEFGQKHKTTFISKSFLIEHGEVLMKNNAFELIKVYL